MHCPFLHRLGSTLHSSMSVEGGEELSVPELLCAQVPGQITPPRSLSVVCYQITQTAQVSRSYFGTMVWQLPAANKHPPVKVRAAKIKWISG